MKTTFLLFCVLLFSAVCARAQPGQKSRAELFVRSDFTNYEVFPQPDSTVLVLAHETFVRRHAEPFLLFRFGHELNLLWQRPLNLPRGSKFLKFISEDKTLFLLFEGAKRSELVLLKVHARTGEQVLSTHQLPENSTFSLTQAKALRGYLFLTGLENDRLTVLHLDPEKSSILKLPAIYDQSSALSGFQADTLAGRMEFIMTESNGLISRLQIKRLAPDGRLFSTSFLQSNDRNYLSGALTPGDSTRKIIAGSYSLRDLRYPQGFFTGPFLNTGSQQLQFFDFTSFSHFFDYLRPRRLEKMQRRLQRFRVSRKTYYLRQRFLMHEMYTTETGFILAGEQYYPKYEGDGSSNRVFSGFGFTQAVASGFDLKGNLLWENSFPLKDVQQFELEQVTSASVHGAGFIICYPDKDAVRYKIINGSQSSSNELSLQITPVAPGETAQNTDLYGVNSWYKNHFLAFGKQRVKSSGGVRNVFFLNKISF